MHYRLCLFLAALPFWIGTFPLFVEAFPEVLNITEGEGQNIKPLLEVDSEGRVWLAWQRNREGCPRWVESDGRGHLIETEWDIFTRYYDSKVWSPEIIVMDDGAEWLSFDMAADKEGKVWAVWISTKTLREQ
ncbi:MAG: hypothetical protein DRP97_05605, partial [Candidatus Latescibacterota bacterium]